MAKCYHRRSNIPLCTKPTYLDVKLYRTLEFCRHLESLHRKLTLRVVLVRRLVKSSLGAVKESYAQQPLALILFTTEYCGPAWCRSNHTSFIDKLINDALRMVIDCLRHNATNSLLVLAEKKPANVRQKTSHDSFS